MFTLRPVGNQPLIDAANNPELGGNINGPSLIRVPDWVETPMGQYYLYFAHHEGKTIRLAYANSIAGPWTIYAPGALHLKQTPFCQQPPARADTHPDVLKMIDAGVDGDYPHIASPDVHIDKDQQQILMYFHGRMNDGTQQTRLAISTDGITFMVAPGLLGKSYFRVFQYKDYFYAIALGGLLYRSVDGRTGFAQGPELTDQNYRHGAILSKNDLVYVIWSRAEDCPERLLISRLDSDGPWNYWRLVETTELHRPTADWEGANEPMVASRYGGLMSRANQLRDPCVFHEPGRTYVGYSVAAEQGLAIGELVG